MSLLSKYRQTIELLNCFKRGEFMDINFKGLVDLHTLPTTEPLLPLYEAIVNSIQSINQGKIDNGQIEVQIQRESDPTLFESWETDIENITIRDNGVGFTEDNFKSFNTYATDFKKMLGCKGVGRMIWLKAFQSVEIESVYQENDKFYHRKFTFDRDNAVNNECKEEFDNTTIKTTIVSLKGLRTKNKTNTPKRLSTIARDILNHCFIYFVLEKAPNITVSDDNETISINKLYDDIGKDNITTEHFKIDDYDFQLIHYKNFNPNSSNHFLNLCANDRRVNSFNLQSVLNGVNSKFTTENGNFVYCGYITSKYLDDNVNRERTAFNIEENYRNLYGTITKSEIINEATKLVFNYLSCDIDMYNENKRTKIEAFVYNKNPRYRLLLSKFPECINNILLSDDDEKLELELFKQEQSYKLKLKEEGKSLQKTIRENTNKKDIVKMTTAYAEKLSEMGKSSLAEYIVHRKSVLDILEDNLKYQDATGKSYAYEESIHQLVFPMQQTSDDIDYTSHNLWLIDEKLSYHYYLASDKKIKSMAPIRSDSINEPDITIFDSPFAFTDENQQPFRNITIIEFKRPGRENYSLEENPIQQVIDYMDDIVSGKIKTKDGLMVDGNDSIRFFCYILCDVNDKIKKYAKQNDFKSTPDGIGYYYYLNNYNAYIEIMPYNKMIQDSKKRNKILFDKLFNQ